MYKASCECISGVACPSLLKDAHLSRSRICCNERLAGALVIPPNSRGGRIPLDERDGVLVITPQMYGSRLSDY